jgi:hypothetical protein
MEQLKNYFFLVFKDFINTKNTLQQMKLVQCEFGLVSGSACQLSCHTVTIIKCFTICTIKLFTKIYMFPYLPLSYPILPICYPHLIAAYGSFHTF